MISLALDDLYSFNRKCKKEASIVFEVIFYQMKLRKQAFPFFEWSALAISLFGIRIGEVSCYSCIKKLINDVVCVWRFRISFTVKCEYFCY